MQDTCLPLILVECSNQSRMRAQEKPRSVLQHVVLVSCSNRNCNRPITHGSFGPPESSSKITCRSVQPFFCSSPETLPILYNGAGHPPKLPFPWEDPSPHIIHGSVGSPKSTVQMAYRFVHPFLQVRCQRHRHRVMDVEKNEKFSAFSPWQIIYCPKLRRHS